MLSSTKKNNTNNTSQYQTPNVKATVEYHKHTRNTTSTKTEYSSCLSALTKDLESWMSCAHMTELRVAHCDVPRDALSLFSWQQCDTGRSLPISSKQA